jgi:hypothetical protein
VKKESIFFEKTFFRLAACPAISSIQSVKNKEFYSKRGLKSSKYKEIAGLKTRLLKQRHPAFFGYFLHPTG